MVDKGYSDADKREDVKVLHGMGYAVRVAIAAARYPSGNASLTNLSHSRRQT